MVSSLFLTCLLVAASDPTRGEPSRSDAVAEAYKAAKAQAGRGADAQVKLALWCEAHGLSAERLKHLTLATLIDPAHVTARGLLGLVLSGGKWQRPEEVGKQMRDNPRAQATLREYLERRAATPDRADDQWRLARWCERSGLDEQARAHYSAVVRLDPRREAGWKKLGYKKNGVRWVRPEELAALKAEAERDKQAYRRWRPVLEKYREALGGKSQARRAEAESSLARVSDPRAVAAVWDVLVAGDERCQLMAVQVLGQIDGAAASRAVAALALFSPSPTVRGRAVETAIRRDPRDYLDAILAMIRKPFTYKVQSVSGPGSEGVLFVEGERYNLQRLYRVEGLDPSTLPARLFTPDVPFNPFSVPNLMVAAGWPGAAPAVTAATAEQLGQSLASDPAAARVLLRQHAAALNGASGTALPTFALQAQVAAVRRDQAIAARILQAEQRAQDAQQRLVQDIQAVELTNSSIRELNDRTLPVARAATGKDFGADRDAWQGWWTDQLGYAYQSPRTQAKPTFTDVVVYSAEPPRAHSACFAAGTPVYTIDGPRAIEELQVGDRVLSQDTTTGALSFQPVLAIHHNKPAPTLKLRLGGETVVATGIHRFWKAGKGWAMARDLKPGDVVRTLSGTARLESAEADTVRPVFNLDVARNRTFFAGKQGCLVYDFSIVQPVAKPFDGQGELAASDSDAR
jgi:hypothetical protein